ncbi:MAG: choice-of-anchor D domain-containing protein [Nitrospirae bacterium]|nr:choice-of-anchor D domain-containing protein [Nitrospirota bacterium]
MNKERKTGHILRQTVFLSFLVALVLGLAAFSEAAFSPSGYIGPEIAVATRAYDQQNPYTIYLPDKNLWFVVWEDRRNYSTTSADIYGQFISEDGSFCGSEFQITAAAGNQTMPRAAYRMVGNGKIVVVWQDTRPNFVYFRQIANANIPDPANCGAYVPPGPAGGTQIGFNVTQRYDKQVTQNTNGPFTVTIGYGAGGTQLDYFGMVLSPVVHGDISPITVSAGGQTMTDATGTGNLNGPGGNGSIDYQSGFVSAHFLMPVSTVTPITVTYSYYTYVFNFPPTNLTNDRLLSRKSPGIAYDPVRDEFWIVWNESRTILNRISEVCFDIQVFDWSFGDTVFPGYVALDGASLAELTNEIGVAGADIIRNDTIRTNRLIAASHDAFTETYEYEFFNKLNNITLDADTTSPETLFAWEGIRQKGVLTCTCTDNNSNKVCDPADTITSSFETSSYDDGKVHIYSLFDKEIPQAVIYSMGLDSGAATAYYPALGFDPVTQRFLAAWEDMRDGANTKVYGRIVESGGGLYNSDFIISYEDLNGDGNIDDNVANSKQTKPFVSYDPVNQRFFVAWQDGRNGTLSLENLDIFGQKVDAEGSLRGNNFSVFTLPYNQYNPAIAYNEATNVFLAVWKDARNADKNICSVSGLAPFTKPCGSDVYGQRFTLGQSSLTLLNPDNTPLTPPLLNQFENPPGSGVVEVGLTDTQSFKIRNTGDTTLKIQGIYQIPNDPNLCPGPASTWDITPFSFDGLPQQMMDVCDGSDIELVPGAELTLTVRFTPVRGGSFNKYFNIKSDGGNPQVNLSAFSTEPDIRVDGQTPIVSYNFGAVFIGNTADKTFIVSNVGVATLQIYSVEAPAAPFSIQNDGCSGKSVAPGATCSIVVRFTPTAVGVFSSSFYINSNDPETTPPSHKRFEVDLTGAGGGAPNITVSPLAIDFGNVQVGQTSPAQTINVRNDGTMPLTISSISTPGAPFASSHNCPIGPATLAVGETCQVTVTATPSIQGAVGSSIVFTSDDPTEPTVTTTLSVTGVVAPQISVDLPFVTFPSTPTGSTTSQSVTVTNVGSANLVITSITNPTPDFSITGTTCIGTHAPAAACTITVSFSPATTGIQSSSFVINSNDPVTPAFTVNLSGTGSTGGGGLPPNIQVTPTLVNFGSHKSGTISLPETVTVSNTGAGDLVIGTIQYPGKPYTITFDSCSGQTIPPGGTCTLEVIFNPTRPVYYYPYYIVINSNDPDMPKARVTLRGIGTY